MTASAPLSSSILPGHETVDSSQRAGEPEVWGLLRGRGERWVRLLGYTPATAEYGAGWEIGLRLDTDGQWRLSWLGDSEVLEVEIRPLSV